ncbi:S-layer homology domain-containing protein [Paenibacillus arenilitoris]|uniref:S-layer homology domain-containing protein n=1 Tax=Paenibacillus arenilitoris TaxID=2772299 RepID=A0A927HA84_9BACL|nr:S-layer homology domain-containing protein [Paenibacillus arenilitoris]MBD2872374.1 S-layer homology domain-containing protein [Paenibacillus arenilitoris]
MNKKWKKLILSAMIATAIVPAATVVPASGNVALAAAPTLSLNKTSVMKGAELTASGMFEPSSWITLRAIDGEGKLAAFDAVRTDAGGRYSFTFTVPSNTVTGAMTVYAGSGDQVVQATVQVSSPDGGPSNPPPVTPTPQPTPEPTPEPEAPVFNDVSDHWASDAIGKLAKAGILEGMPDGSFKPDNRMSRAEYMAVLYRLLGLEDAGSSPAFTDVPNDVWYSTYVKSLSAMNIVSGYPDGSFRPDKEMTREEAFVLLYRAVKDKLQPVTTSAPAYTDSADVSDWAREAIEALTRAGILQGTPDGKVNPKKTITRAEIAKIVAPFVD